MLESSLRSPYEPQNDLVRPIEAERYEEALTVYMHMDRRIKQVARDKATMIESYQAQPAIHSTWNWDENGNKVTYTSMETRIINYVDLTTAYDDLLNSLVFRGELFKEWLKTLTRAQKDVLGRGVDVLLDHQAYLKIEELERQVPAKYRF